MELILLVLYFVPMSLITVFSLVQFELALQYIRSGKTRERDTSDPFQPDEFPVVTIQLPVYNEKYVVQRLLKSIEELDYPSDKMEVLVLDDSTDETTSIIRDSIESMQHHGYDVKLHHRDKRKGYKAGALQEGLLQSKGEFIAIFDADFIPGKDFLRKTIGWFRDPVTGMVQTKWGHVNESYSLLTRLQAFGLNAHFTVEQSGRSAAGGFINFNGTAGVWRKKCMLDGGGWDPDILSEDLDLSYRAQLRGWKFRYLENIETPAELPVLMQAVRSQQYRWTKGGAETARKNLGAVLRSSVSLKNKLYAVFHLLNGSVFPALLLAAFCSIPLLLLKHLNPTYHFLFDLGYIFLAGFAGLSIFYWIPSKIHHPQRSIGYFALHYPLFLSFGMGLSFQNSVAVMKGLLGIKSEFVRTPKFNLSGSQWHIKGKDYAGSKVTWYNLVELLLLLYFSGGVGLAIYLRDFSLAGFHLMLVIGFAGVLYYSFKTAGHDA